MNTQKSEIPKTIYCDFDGTITKKDAVNTFFELYADPKWTEYEDLWVQGRISSKENAISQVALLPEMTEDVLNQYINSIEIDDYFAEFVDFVKSNGIKLVIISDGFDLFIEKTLEKHNLKGIKFFANHLIYENNKFNIEFPYHNSKCDIGAGMCKCARVNEKDYCYIGDGTSDLCVARKANVLFASKVLKTYCKENNVNCIPFENFSNIIRTLERYK